MSCDPNNTLELKAGHINRRVFILDDGKNPIDLTGATISFVARESAEDDPIFEIEQTAHSDAEAGESTVDIDLREVSDAIISKGARLKAEVLVHDAADVLVHDEMFTVLITPFLGAE